nr:small nuclear ribonucleoprotein D-like protein [Cryptomonas sp.]
MKIKSTFDLFNIISSFKSAKGLTVLIELKCGSSCNGILIGIDEYFNAILDKVTITSPDGVNFKEALGVLVKGKTIRYLRLY